MTNKFILQATKRNIKKLYNSDNVDNHITDLDSLKIKRRWRKKYNKAYPLKPYQDKTKYRKKREKMLNAYMMYSANPTGSKSIAKALGIHRSTLYVYVKMIINII